MSHHHKLSLREAILINMNIMLGAGLFINAIVLAEYAGLLSAFSYALIGVLMFPLIASIMQLVAIHPSGGFYTFASKEINPFAGFLGAWSYATGKLASATIMIHISLLFLRQLIPALSLYDPITLDVITIGIFVLLNMLDIRTNSSLQTIFFGLKLIPVLFGIFAGFYVWSIDAGPMLPMKWEGIPLTLPLVLFAMVGFEAACSLSSRIKDSHHNGPRAIMISFVTVVCLNVLYQLLISGSLGTLLTALPDFRFIFPTMFQSISATFSERLVPFLHIAIASSALSGSYGIIFSNTWNWYALAEHNHLFGAEKITQYNRFHIPWICVLIQGALCLFFLWITGANQLSLQQLAVLGISFSYLMSVVSLVFALKNRSGIPIKKYIPVLALGSCFILLASTGYSLLTDGAYALGMFSLLYVAGITMFYLTPGQRQ